MTRSYSVAERKDAKRSGEKRSGVERRGIKWREREIDNQIDR